jgi:hypothetical protein
MTAVPRARSAKNAEWAVSTMTTCPSAEPGDFITERKSGPGVRAPFSLLSVHWSGTMLQRAHAIFADRRLGEVREKMLRSTLRD